MCEEEIKDPNFRYREHGNPATRDAGCKGPMCVYGKRKYARERRRQDRNSKNPRPKYVPTWQDLFIQRRINRYKEQRCFTGANYY